MKKLVINLPKGFEFKITETADTLEIDIQPESVRTVYGKVMKGDLGHLVSHNSSTGGVVVRKEIDKRATAKTYKRSGTGGTWSRKGSTKKAQKRPGTGGTRSRDGAVKTQKRSGTGGTGPRKNK